jgi:hypothetical protein
VTDGQPTDPRGSVDIEGFRHCLQSRSPIDRIFVTIVACTDDDSCIDYLDKWDRQIRKSNQGGDLIVLKDKKGDETNEFL